MKKCNTCDELKPLEEYHKGSGGAKYCYQCKSCRSERQAKYYKENWFKKFFHVKRSECKKRNIQFDLDAEYLESIWTGVCPVFGTSLVKHDKSNPNCPALDRINPSKGYTKGNVVWLSARANRIKYDATISELKALVKWYEGATTISKESTLKRVEAPNLSTESDDIV